MKKLLIVVDMQNDFITGSLGSAMAEEITGNVEEKIKEYLQEGQTVIYTKDTHFEHYPDTQEGKNLPVPHCIRGTEGWQLEKRIEALCEKAGSKVYEKQTFGSKELAEDIQKGIYDDYDQIEFVGLCTDICVISNVMLVKAFLPEVPLVVDACCCAGVTKESHENALAAMKSCQVQIQN